MERECGVADLDKASRPAVSVATPLFDAPISSPQRAGNLAVQRRARDRSTSPDSARISAAAHRGLRSSAQPMDPATRAFMEPRFGQDFSQVRIHTGRDAAESARSINAVAYTVGRDLVFGKDQYAPHEGEGQ